jgi:hypothetical protein
MTKYISALFPLKNRLPALLIKVKACEKRNRESLLVFLAYQIRRPCQASDLFPHILMLIGLGKPRVRAKGINHPKHAVEAACACLKRESATSSRKPFSMQGNDAK